MAGYAKWNEKIVPVTSLLLDAQNPRIPPTSRPLDQRGLIAELLEHDDVLSLAKDIAENGYAPVESMIGLGRDGKTILEGNRRLAALKLLVSPETAPEGHLKRVRRLAQDAQRHSLQQVRVLFAPTREAAAPLIMQKHTRQQVEKWSPVMQARFYRGLLDSGLTAEQLAKTYGSTRSEVIEFLRVDAAYELACRVELPESVRAKVQDPRRFPVTILQRILEVPAALEALGIDFDERGSIRGRVRPDEFKRGFARILTDIARETINTRTVNRQADVEAYLSTIKEDLPNTNRKGSFKASDFPKSGASTVSKSGTTKKNGRTNRQSGGVLPPGTRCEVNDARIKDVFAELRGLKVERNPNASAVMFRILLELCVGHYLDSTRTSRPKSKVKAAQWPLTLRELLVELLGDSTVSIPTEARKALKKLLSGKAPALSLDGLDQYVHNRFATPTARELRSYWDLLEDVFGVLLKEPQTRSATTN